MKNVITKKPAGQFVFKGKVETSKADKKNDKKKGIKEGSKKDTAIDNKKKTGKGMLAKAMKKLSGKK